jgi:ubiquitin-protein ligase
LIRLEYEWRKLQRSFAYHPHIRIVSMQDDPPDEYEIEFRVRTLCVGESGQLEYTDIVPMRVELPASFPYVSPVVRPHKGLFHPNVSWEGIHLSSAWQPTDTLVDFLQKVGELLAFRAYDPESVVNPGALEWMEANAESLPLDGTADFSPDAVGEPLERICQHGPGTIEQVRKQLEDIRDSMLDVDLAPGLTEVRDFSRHLRQTLNLFMESDVPDHLHDQAAQLDEWAGELPASIPMWESLRGHRAVIQDVRATNGALLEKREPILRQIRALEALAPATQFDDLKAATAAIPKRQSMDIVRLKLPSLVREAEELLTTLHDRVKALDWLPPLSTVRDDSPLARQLQTEMDTAISDTVAARETAASVQADFEPIFSTARTEAAAIKQIAAWREYLDLLTTGRVLEQKLAKLGAAGVQSFYIENASGEFGPFQLDEPVDLGSARVAVRSTGRDRLRLVEVRTTDVIGRSDNGALAIRLGASAENEGELNTFRLSERWEDLAVQFDFLVRQSAQSIVQLAAPLPPSESWCGKLLEVLTLPESVRAVREQHRKSSHHWRSLLADLQSLGPVKARIEAWNYVQRIGEAVPGFLQALAEQRGILKKSVADLGAIVARCGRDVDTDRLVIPPKLAQPYSNNVALRDHAQNEIARLEKLLSQTGSHVARQLASRTLVGTQGVPNFRMLTPFPPDMEELVAGMTDEALLEHVDRLEGLLKMPLRGDAWQPTSSPASRPTEPEPEPDIAAVLPEEEVAEFADEPAQAEEFTESGAIAEEDSFLVEQEESDDSASDQVEI